MVCLILPFNSTPRRYRIRSFESKWIAFSLSSGSYECTTAKLHFGTEGQGSSASPAVWLSLVALVVMSSLDASTPEPLTLSLLDPLQSHSRLLDAFMDDTHQFHQWLVSPGRTKSPACRQLRRHGKSNSRFPVALVIFRSVNGISCSDNCSKAVPIYNRQGTATQLSKWCLDFIPSFPPIHTCTWTDVLELLACT